MRPDASASRPTVGVDAPPLLVFGDDWGRRVSTLQHIVRRFLGKRPIAWVNGINHRAPRLTRYDLARAAEKVTAMFGRRAAPYSADAGPGPRPDLVLAPRVIPWHQYPWVQAVNGRWLARDVAAATRTLFRGAAPIVVSSTPVAAYAMPFLAHRALVYFCLDEYAAMDGVDPAIVLPAERRMLSLADAAFVTASTMLETKRPLRGTVHHVPQGVNYEHFASAGPVDAEIARLPKPVLGFAGTIEPRLDLPILSGIADRFPEGSLVLVGEMRMSLGSLASRPNVHVLARRTYGDLPAVLRAFDVGLIPYTLSDWTRAVDPLKLLEYLASGLPVVATPLPDVLRHGAMVEVGGEEANAFSAAIARALASLSTADASARRQYAAGHTWEARAALVARLLDEAKSHADAQAR